MNPLSGGILCRARLKSVERWLSVQSITFMVGARDGSGDAVSAAASNGRLSQSVALGEKIFFDQSLSVSGRQSCASCHNPVNAHAQSNDLVVQLDGANLDPPGFRAVPPLRHLQLNDAKHDRFHAGKTQLTDAERRGLTLFSNPGKGNRAACHPSAKDADGSRPLFTDFNCDNLGVPRNAATGKTFFHNGAFNNLRDALRFYVQRDINLEEWYPTGSDGMLQEFNDLPPAYRGNANTVETRCKPPAGGASALSADDIEDVIRFPGTLTDRYAVQQ